MKESLFEAKEELKRVDHQIYVSLKYTRTVDVLMNCLGRMIDAYSCMIDALLALAVEKKRVKQEYVPTSPLERLDFAKRLYSTEENVQKNMELYALMRKIVKTSPKKEQEFRRHVTLRTSIDNKPVAVSIDIVTEYYAMMKEFYEWIEKKGNE
jgi:flagellar biosynthesis/type III secretory pathway ATPase